MKRTRLLPRLAATLVLTLALLPATGRAADPPKPDDPFRLVPLPGNVYALHGRGGNVGFLVGPASVLLVDAQFASMAPGIQAQIAKVTPLPVKFLVNTHYHNDHVGGNEFFSHTATIVGHENVRRRMLDSPREVLAEAPAAADSLRRMLAAAKDSTEKTRLVGVIKRLDDQVTWAKTVKIEGSAPAVTLVGDGEMRLHLGEETVRLVHYGPGHTDGDCVVFFEKAHVVHMGDLYFHHIIPYIDFGAGASVPGYIASIDSALAQAPADARFIPGHGEVSGAEGLREFRDYLAFLLDAVRKAHDGGATLEAALKTVQLPPYTDWSGYPDRLGMNIEGAWRSLYK